MAIHHLHNRADAVTWMTAVGGIEPRRLALRYEPPGIIVEYIYHSTAAKQLYHHEIDLKTELSSFGASRFSVRLQVLL